jgi:Phage terminase large subunit (GpA)
MTLSELQWRLLYHSNMLVQESLVQSNAALVSILEPRATGDVWRWLEQHTYLDEKETANPGQYSTKLTPYVREPMDCFGDRSVTDLTLCWGTQTSKSLTLRGGMAYRIVNDPCAMLWVMPNTDLAKSFAQNRWMPFVDYCAPLKAQKPTGIGARTLYKRTEQSFAKATVHWAGSNSPANIASWPAGFLVMDEVDKFAVETDDEAGALENAEERTKTFPYPLRVKASTPTTKDGMIWIEFLMGDQRYYNMPCPHCEKLITFKHSQLKWFDAEPGEAQTDGEWDMRKVKRNAFYRCQLCEGKILDRHKAAMLEAGQWVATHPNAEQGRRSYHLNSLYAPWRDCMFGAIAVKWLQSMGKRSKRHNFINSMLAEPWDESRMFDDAEIAVFEYDADKIAIAGGRVPTMFVDIQEKEYWTEIRSWDRGAESFMLWCGRVEEEQDLVDLQTKYRVDGRCVGVDMAHWPNRAAQMIVRNGWRGLWGSDKPHFKHTEENGAKVYKYFGVTERRDPYLGTIRQSETNPRAVWKYWSNPSFKDMLKELMEEEPSRYHILSTVCPEYPKHMNAEIKLFKEDRYGRPVGFWKQIRKANHLRDCALGTLVMAIINNIIEDVEIPSPIVPRKPMPVAA